MKSIHMIAAVVGCFVASGTMALADAEDGKQKVTIFTPRLSGDHFVCSAVNVSDKKLGITFTLLDTHGGSLDPNPSDQFSVRPGWEAELDLRFSTGFPPTDGYCKVAVSGTSNRNDVRVDLLVYWTKTITPDPTSPLIQLARTVQGY